MKWSTIVIFTFQFMHRILWVACLTDLTLSCNIHPKEYNWNVHWVKLRGDCSFCWYWWNCWTLLSFHNYILDINAGPYQIRKVANQTATLQCSAVGGNSLTWRHNDKKITITDDKEYTGGTLTNPGLTIAKLTRWHAGNYTCETSYDSVTAVSSVITLTIEGSTITSLSFSEQIFGYNTVKTV